MSKPMSQYVRLILLSILMASPAMADPLQFSFTGTVSAFCGSFLPSSCPHGFTGVQAGDPITGAFSFDPASAQYGEDLGNLSITVGAHNLNGPALISPVTDGDTQWILIRSDWDNHINAGFYFLLSAEKAIELGCNADRSFLWCPIFPGTPDFYTRPFILELRGPGAGYIGLDTVPGTADPSLINLNSSAISVYPKTTVPEPSTIELLFVGLVSLVALRRRIDNEH